MRGGGESLGMNSCLKKYKLNFWEEIKFWVIKTTDQIYSPFLIWPLFIRAKYSPLTANLLFTYIATTQFTEHVIQCMFTTEFLVFLRWDDLIHTIYVIQTFILFSFNISNSVIYLRLTISFTIVTNYDKMPEENRRV